MKDIIELFDNFQDNITNRGMSFLECEELLSKNLVLIYGCGNSGTILYERLARAGIDVVAFIDNGGSIYGQQYHGTPIFTSNEMQYHLKEDKRYVCIVTLLDILNFGSIKNQIINELNIFNNLQVFFFTQFRAFTSIFGLDKKPEFSAYLGENPEILLENKEKIEYVYNLLSDEQSRNCYLELLNYYIASDFVAFTVLPFEEHFFAYDLYEINMEEVFIDCGAYNGDTLDIFLRNQNWFFKRYIAIEADEVNYACVLEKVKNLGLKNIEVIQNYITDGKKDISFEARGTSYSRGEENLNGKILKGNTLDELCYEYEPTFIKINIEGADVEAIVGAKKIIKDYSPIIAVQGHHKIEHLWKIVETIEAFSTGKYRYYLRNYMGITEFTFYAIPQKRLGVSVR